MKETENEEVANKKEYPTWVIDVLNIIIVILFVAVIAVIGARYA